MDSFPLLIIFGFSVGMLIGMTGMGGGAIMTPFLILVLKIDPVLAVGTDLTFAAVTKWFSGIQHRRSQNVDLRMVAWMALGSIPASFLMSSLVLNTTAENGAMQPILAKIIGAVLIMVSIYTLARVFNWINVKQDERWPPAWALSLIGAVGGALVGLTSVGSGTVIMAFLMIFFAIPAVKMIGLDVMHGALLTTVPAMVYGFGGQVAWEVVALLCLGSIPGAWLGTRLVKRIPQRLVRTALGAVLIWAGVRLWA